MAFIGLRVPREFALDLQSRVNIDSYGEPEDPAWYHITMVYLGDHVPVEKLAASMETLLDLTAGQQPFQVSVRSVGTFPPHPTKGTVPVIGKVESEALHTFRQKVCDALKAHGIEYDEKFPVYKPHVTLAYSRDPGVSHDHAADQDVEPAVTWSVTDMVLWGGDQGEDRVSMTFPFGSPRKTAAQSLGATDVTWAQVAALASLPGTVGKVINQLGREWAEGDPARLLAQGPRIGTIWVTKDADDTLHIDFRPRHSRTIGDTMKTACEGGCTCDGACSCMVNRLVARVLQANTTTEGDVKYALQVFQTQAQNFLDKQDVIRGALKLVTKMPQLRTPEDIGALTEAVNLAARKWYAYQYLLAPGSAFFLAALRTYAMPPALRKKIETTSKAFLKKPRRPSLSTREDWIAWYDRMATVVGTQLELASQVLSKGKLHEEGAPVSEGAPSSGMGTKVKVGPVTLVNTGGFAESVMRDLVDVTEKSVRLIQQSGLGAILYGDIQITNSLMRANTLAWYDPKTDHVYVRADGKPDWDTVHSLTHELGHRWDFKKLKPGVKERLYYMVSGQERGRKRELTKPELGDKVDYKGTELHVVGYATKRTGPLVILEAIQPSAKGQKAKYQATYEQYHAMLGENRSQQVLEDPNYKGFVTNYAKKDATENFAEMFAFYCMDKLPVAQSGLFEELVFGDGKVARDLKAIREVVGSLRGRP